MFLKSEMITTHTGKVSQPNTLLFHQTLQREISCKSSRRTIIQCNHRVSHLKYITAENYNNKARYEAKYINPKNTDIPIFK